ncbi:hypothetical protein B0T25DRAFT_510752 [Lasiosphaeria hispida]|uniref:DUF202 domain-containing protein n=1 Tax=Lasiosphaeria hispida TaxID=260671 RepID=A0AAJ0M887_9PEZI|nr:hypothetical protein B0T25DRAFT_510752 [Lasiosphaeria hispida]
MAEDVTSSMPPVPPPIAASPSAGPSRERRGSLNLQQSPRRRSTQERINDILEGARERADSLSQNPSAQGSPRLQPLLSGPGTASYTLPGPPRLPRSPRLRGRASPAIAEESSGDDERDDGDVVTRQPDRYPTLSYQNPRATHTSLSPRRRSTAAVSVRRASVVTEDGPGDVDAVVRGDVKKGWKKRLEYFQSIELENKGSVARDHLALERTFLAWLRTSLAFASIGIAITQLFRLNTSLAEEGKQADSLRHLGKPLGATFLSISILILFLGYKRYLTTQYWVIKGKFPASRGTIMLVSFIAFAVTVASLIVVVAVQRSS